MIADLVDDFARIDGLLILRIVALSIGAWFVINGIYGLLHPDRVLKKNRLSAPKLVLKICEPFNLMSIAAVKVFSWIVLAIGFVVVAIALYLFAHPELLS
jgi:hypothetical protein